MDHIPMTVAFQSNELLDIEWEVLADAKDYKVKRKYCTIGTGT